MHFIFIQRAAGPAADLGELQALVDGEGGVEDEEDEDDRVDEGGRVKLGDCAVVVGGVVGGWVGG